MTTAENLKKTEEIWIGEVGCNRERTGMKRKETGINWKGPGVDENGISDGCEINFEVYWYETVKETVTDLSRISFYIP